MISGYTKNSSILFLIALLKAHGIKRIIISPGTTNLELTAGLQYDGGFEIYSSVDERSAAYMACGMVTESKEPVVITCTEATASRDYMPGLTEAFYRKLPILVVTGVHRYNQIGHLEPQVIDRSVSPKDVFVHKEQLPIIKDKEDEIETQIKINRAILALTRHGAGPVHIDLPCCNYDYDFSIKELPNVNVIKRYYYDSEFPLLPNDRKIIFIGSHLLFDDKTTKLIDKFCEQNNSVVICDHTSGYKGNYGIKPALLSSQNNSYKVLENINLVIHLGEAVADWATMNKLKKANNVWRVSPDGELRNTFGKLKAVFEMNEHTFFKNYISKENSKKNIEYFNEFKNSLNKIVVPLEKISFSNIYAAMHIMPNLPINSVIHLGPSNTIRAWSFFDYSKKVTSSSNMGCRGIDGVLSSCLGASLVNKDKIYFCVLGDLTFFYDMNALGNRFVSSNLRILLINNNGGSIFKQEEAPGHKFFGDEVTSEFIAASGHFGNQSYNLVKHFAQDLGFEYLCASSKDEFKQKYTHFITSEITDKPMIFELFTKNEDERNAFNIMSSLDVSMEGHIKQMTKQVLGDKGISKLKKIISSK